MCGSVLDLSIALNLYFCCYLIARARIVGNLPRSKCIENILSLLIHRTKFRSIIFIYLFIKPTC